MHLFRQAMADSMQFEGLVLKKLQEYKPEAVLEDVRELAEESIKYINFYKDINDLVEAIDNSFLATESNMRRNQTLTGGNKMDQEMLVLQFVKKSFESLKNSEFKGKNLYAGVPVEQKGTSDKYPETQKTKEFRLKHKEAHPECGKLELCYNQNLNFSKARPLRSMLGIKNHTENLKSDSFLYAKQEDFIDAFRKRFTYMEALMTKHLKEKHRIELKRTTNDTKSFEKDSVVFGRITHNVDSEGNLEELTISSVYFEFLAHGNDEVMGCYMDFSKCANTDFLLFPNMYLAVQVEGSFATENESVAVSRIFELDDDLDTQESFHEVGRNVEEKVEGLIFKGPYNMDGNAHFGGYDMLLQHVKDCAPNFIVLIGPFLSTAQMREDSVIEFETIDPFPEVRDKNLKMLLNGIKKLSLGHQVEVIVVADFFEADNFLPLPVQPVKTNLKQVEHGISLHFVGSPSVVSILDGRYTIGLTSVEVLRSLAQMPKKHTSKWFLSGARSLVSQHNLLPVFPLNQIPIDITMGDKLNLERPLDLLIMPSSLPSFVQKLRGTVVANCREIFSSADSWDSFGRVYFDTQASGPDSIRFEVKKF